MRAARSTDRGIPELFGPQTRNGRRAERRDTGDPARYFARRQCPSPASTTTPTLTATNQGCRCGGRGLVAHAVNNEGCVGLSRVGRFPSRERARHALEVPEEVAFLENGRANLRIRSGHCTAPLCFLFCGEYPGGVWGVSSGDQLFYPTAPVGVERAAQNITISTLEQVIKALHGRVCDFLKTATEGKMHPYKAVHPKHVGGLFARLKISNVPTTLGEHRP